MKGDFDWLAVVCVIAIIIAGAKALAAKEKS